MFDKKWKKFTKSVDDLNEGAGILLVSPDKKILLQMRSEVVNNPNVYGTTGGHLNSKDKIAYEAAKREFYEETSYSGPFLEPERLSYQVFQTPYTTFLAKTTSEINNLILKPLPEFEHEVAYYSWFSLDEILNLNNLHPGLKDLISNKDVVMRIRNYVED